jgi:DNA-binding GntR family transcriptional regulator
LLFNPDCRYHARTLARKSTVKPKVVAALTVSATPPPSVPDRVAASLRELIMNGTLAPGDPVVESKIARGMGIGQPTVREALKTLEGEGLITRQINRGSSVTKLSPQEIDMIFRLRLELEPLAVTLACETWDERKAARLKAAFHALETAARQKNLQAYFQADLAFHRTLWALSDNPFLERMLFQIVAPQFAFEVMLLFRKPTFSFAENLKDHRRILDAVVDGTAEEAVAVTRESIASFRETDRALFS